MSDAYIIRNRSTSRYLEWNQALREWSWLAAFPEYATPFTFEQAEAWITSAHLGAIATIDRDPYRREPSDHR